MYIIYEILDVEFYVVIFRKVNLLVLKGIINIYNMYVIYVIIYVHIYVVIYVDIYREDASGEVASAYGTRSIAKELSSCFVIY